MGSALSEAIMRARSSMATIRRTSACSTSRQAPISRATDGWRSAAEPGAAHSATQARAERATASFAVKAEVVSLDAAVVTNCVQLAALRIALHVAQSPLVRESRFT